MSLYNPINAGQHRQTFEKGPVLFCCNSSITLSPLNMQTKSKLKPSHTTKSHWKLDQIAAAVVLTEPKLCAQTFLLSVIGKPVCHWASKHLIIIKVIYYVTIWIFTARQTKHSLTIQKGRILFRNSPYLITVKWFCEMYAWNYRRQWWSLLWKKNTLSNCLVTTGFTIQHGNNYSMLQLKVSFYTYIRGIYQN